MKCKKCNYWAKQKSWWRNMDNIIIDYLHKSETNDFYLIHMYKKCRIDRTCCYSRMFRWK